LIWGQEENRKCTYVGSDTSNYDLLLAGSTDCVAKVLIVPGIDFPLAIDQGGVGVHLNDFLREGTIGTFEKTSVNIARSGQVTTGNLNAPVSALVVSTVGRLNTFPMAA